MKKIRGPACPKCKSKSTWLGLEDQSLVLKCLCGLNKYLYHVSTLGEVERIVPENMKDDVPLPLKNRSQQKCLLAIYKAYPDPVRTAQIAAHTNHKNKETYGFVAALVSKGLVERVEERKGLAGGSSWTLTEFGKGQLSAHFHEEEEKANEFNDYVPAFWE